jgi:4'-phosphopantetheinyl transferase
LCAAFAVRQKILRNILAMHLSAHSHDISIKNSENGKPYLACGSALKFNTSDSCGVFACAVTNNVDIGVDIERLRPLNSTRRLIQMSFDATESDMLFAMSNESSRRVLFFGGWTAKEAVVKADGRGLQADIRNIKVYSINHTIRSSVTLSKAENKDTKYKILPFAIKDSYVGAIALNTHIHDIRVKQQWITL